MLPSPEMEVYEFAHQYLSGALGAQPVVMLYDFGDVWSMVLYRQGQFQVEQFIARPGVTLPDVHRHPNVDTYETVLYAWTNFEKNGVLAGIDEVIAGYDCTKIYRDDWHGGIREALPLGTIFLSIQKWDKGVEVTSVGLNWIGPPSSDVHKAQL